MSKERIETKEELEKEQGSISRGKLIRWQKEIDNASKAEQDWRKEAKEYNHIYSDEAQGREYTKKRYNIFWANTQTLRPLIYSQLPKPNITRRYKQDDRIARILSELNERALGYFLDKDNADEVFADIRDDYLIGGRGISRIYFNPGEIVEIEKEGGELEEDLDTDTKRPIIEYVDWRDFLYSPARRWDKVRWIAFRSRMNREELVEKFGSIGNKVRLEENILTNLDEAKDPDVAQDIFKVATVWEIWDKDSRNVIYITPGLDNRVLAEEKDPYGLEDFFPLAKPLGSNATPDSLLPIPLYRMYKSQAEELNEIDSRIRSLVEQLKFCGVYNQVQSDTNIESLLNGKDGDFSPIKLVNPGDNINNSIYTKPIVGIVNVVAQLYQQKLNILQNIRDITGLSDIVRGSSEARETARAQELKGNFAISRIQPLQKEMEFYTRDTIRIMSEMISENFTIEELAEITGLEIIDINSIQNTARLRAEALYEAGVRQIDPNDPDAQAKIQQLQEQAELGINRAIKEPLNKLKGFAITPEEIPVLEQMKNNDQMRCYSIDVETDSTVRVDQNQEKQDRIEYINAISNFSNGMYPLVQAGIITPSAFNELFSFISKPFKIGRNLEEALLTKEELQTEPEQPSVEEQAFMAEEKRKDFKLQLDAKETDIKQQLANVKKAEVLQKQTEHEDKLEFEDANKAADRLADTNDIITKEQAQAAYNTVTKVDIM